MTLLAYSEPLLNTHTHCSNIAGLDRLHGWLALQKMNLVDTQQVCEINTSSHTAGRHRHQRIIALLEWYVHNSAKLL